MLQRHGTIRCGKAPTPDCRNELQTGVVFVFQIGKVLKKLCGCDKIN